MKFTKGQSGNPGGRPKIAKIVEAAGFSIDDLRAEVIQMLVKAMRGLPMTDRSWFAATQQLGHWLIGKPAEQVELKTADSEMTEDEYNAELADIVREEVGKMPAEERLKLLLSQPSETVQ